MILKHRAITFGMIILILLIATGCNTNEPATATADPISKNDSPTPDQIEPESTEAPTVVESTSEPMPTATPIPEPTATPPPTYEPIFVTADCAFTPVLDFDVSCGYLTVPEDRTQPDAAQIRLHVAIFSSSSENPAPDPIVYLEGGPGGNVLETAYLIFEDRFGQFLAERDFIMFDQRGTGLSEPALDCPEYTELTLEYLDDEVSDEESTEIALDGLGACRERLAAEGINLAAYNSVENAADLNDLRTALGYEEWNLYGISYGTKLALTTMRNHPEGIRSVLLDSVFPPQVSLSTELPPNVNRGFNELFEGCAADPDCNNAYPNLESQLFSLAEALEEEPVLVEVTDFFNGRTYDALVDGSSLLGVIFQGLYSEEIIPLLPKMIGDTADGNYSLLSLLISNDISTADFISLGMYYSVQCHEEIVFESVEGLETAVSQHPELALFFGDADANFEICTLWQAGEADPIDNQPISSDIPTLIMAGEYDPITPPAWGELAAQTLSNSSYYFVPGVGHGASVAGDCPKSIAMDFWNDPITPPEAACLSNMSAPDFQTAAAATETELVLIPFKADLGTGPFEGVYPEGWEEQLPGTYIRGSNGLDQTAILHLGGAGFGPDFFLNLLVQQFNFEDDDLVEVSPIVDDNGRTWTAYEAELQGFLIDLATIDDDGFTLLVLMLSDSSENDFLRKGLFIPALSAIQSAE